MWAHYGDKHKGLCLGFEIGIGPGLTKIDYVSKRLTSPIDFSKPLAGVDEAMLNTCLNVKHNGWKYEKEYRLRASLREQRDGVYYISFNRDVDLREVIIGARSSLSIIDVTEAIGPQPYSDIAIWTARAAHSEFNMCRNRDLPQETIRGLTPEEKKRQLVAQALMKNGKE